MTQSEPETQEKQPLLGGSSENLFSAVSVFALIQEP